MAPISNQEVRLAPGRSQLSERLLIVELEGDSKPAAEAALRAPGVLRCTVGRRGHLEILFKGPKERQAALHRSLVESGARVTAFYEQAPNLESHFGEPAD